MLATIESDESYFDIMTYFDKMTIIMAIFYERGKSVNCFLMELQFRAQLSRKVISLKAPKETFRQFTFSVVTMIENL